jgi:beta-glucosidase
VDRPHAYQARARIVTIGLTSEHEKRVLICRVGDWTEPWDPEDPKDREACDRKIEFAICWFGDPVYFGKYPDSMRKQLGDRLPEFTPEEADLVKGSNDFYGMNHYCANYIRHKDTEPEPEDHVGNLDILYQNKKGEWIGPETQSVWLRPMPLGFRKLIKWLSDRYGGPTFYVTENGTSLKGENDLPLEQLLDDEFRCEYFRGYIGALADAHTLDGVDVRGYSAWSLMEYVNSILSTFLTPATPTPLLI